MAFFNKKEEVLDIELTQLGKYQLSKGNFKPVFYAFSDDEILYNVGYAGENTPENNKEASKRIQRDTQRMKALYDHDGSETRTLSLNDSSYTKVRGHAEIARKSSRSEEYPAGDMYGNDFIEDMKMGADDRNLVRNFIGNSSPGEQHIPSWDIDLLLDGKITAVNVSSSSPNVGIQRPVLNVEEFTRVEAKKLPIAHPDLAMTVEDFKLRYDGWERNMNFIDGLTVSLDDDALIFSVVEQNTEYLSDNFEFELFLHNGYREIKGTSEQAEDLKRLYFSVDQRYFSEDEMVATYLETLTDHGLAEVYGFDLRSFNRDTLKDNFRKQIRTVEDLKKYNSQSLVGNTRGVHRMGDMDDLCDPEGPEED